MAEYHAPFAMLLLDIPSPPAAVKKKRKSTKLTMIIFAPSPVNNLMLVS